MNTAQQDIAQRTNRTHQRGNLTQVIDGADVFIGVSGPKVLTQAHIKSMNDQPIIFALANPVPEIYPEEALAAGAAVVGTGRSDFANQINNLLAFPGIFRGILDAKTKYISMDTKVAAATAIASVITEDELNPEFVIPNALDPRVISEVAKAVQENALKEIAIPTK